LVNVPTVHGYVMIARRSEQHEHIQYASESGVSPNTPPVDGVDL
jgi:hypothetical protein